MGSDQANGQHSLCLHRLIECLPHSHRYRVTHEGLRTALFFTRVYARILHPGVAHLASAAYPNEAPLRSAFVKLELTIDHWVDPARLAS